MLPIRYYDSKNRAITMTLNTAFSLTRNDASHVFFKTFVCSKSFAVHGLRKVLVVSSMKVFGLHPSNLSSLPPR
jgi:hypothetical protein